METKNKTIEKKMEKITWKIFSIALVIISLTIAMYFSGQVMTQTMESSEKIIEVQNAQCGGEENVFQYSIFNAWCKQNENALRGE